MEHADINILAIESSCDETAAAVVRNGRCVLSSVISSQIETHTVFGGVVPEIASRKHIENIDYVIKKAMNLRLHMWRLLFREATRTFYM